MTPKQIVDSLSREAKVVFYVLGKMEEMKAEGLIEGGKWEVTTQGDQALAALRDSGFEPTPEEIEWATRLIIEESKKQDENPPDCP